MTELKQTIPAYLKPRITTRKFIQFLKSEGKWKVFVDTYREAKAAGSRLLESCRVALYAVMGSVSFVWFGKEQLHRIHIDEHLILSELQK